MITSPGATISGNLALLNTNRIFTANDAGNDIRDLIIDATIDGGGSGGGITRNGAGLLVINADNGGEA